MRSVLSKGVATSAAGLYVPVAASAATNDVVEGNLFVRVKVTIYGDLQCDYCQTLRTMLDEKLLAEIRSAGSLCSS